MAVTSATTRVQYNGDGSTVAFAVPFYFLADGDLAVYVDDTLQTITSQYTVSGSGVTSGGTVTMVSAPSASETLTIIRSVALTQSVDYVENDTFPAETHEQALDRLTMITQQIDEVLDRVPTFSVNTAASGVTFPEPISEYYLRWNSAGTNLESVLVAPSSGIANVAEDTSPQLGGDLDANGFDIQFDDNTGIRDDSDNEQLTFQSTASAVNHVEITNAITSNAPQINSTGGDGTVGLVIDTKGAGTLTLGSQDMQVATDADTVDLQTGGSSRLDINDSGVRLGAANSRVTTVLDEDTMSSDSATSLATQQSIKAYVDASSGGGGKVLQVVQDTLTSTFSTTSTTYVDITGFSVSITPASTSNKILIIASTNAATNNTLFLDLKRDSTSIFQGDDDGGNRGEASTSVRTSAVSETNEQSIVYLDSPATTSATTYKVQARVNAGTGYVNRTSNDTNSAEYSRTASSIIVMEIDGT